MLHFKKAEIFSYGGCDIIFPDSLSTVQSRGEYWQEPHDQTKQTKLYLASYLQFR